MENRLLQFIGIHCPQKAHNSKSGTNLFFLFTFTYMCILLFLLMLEACIEFYILTKFRSDTWLFNLHELAASKGIKLFPTFVGNNCPSVLITFYVDTIQSALHSVSVHAEP